MSDPKRELRRRIRAARRARVEHPSYSVRRSLDADRVADRVTQAFPDVACVSVYLALPTEPPTETYVETLHRLGVRVLVPVLLPDRDLDWADLDPAGAVMTPLGRDALALADLVVVPALSVDVRGHRLGQGGGSYDRALPRRRPGTPVVAVLNPEEYDVAPVPADAHDSPVDAVVLTDGRYVPVSPTVPPAPA